MSDSLRDQLLKAGFAPPPKADPRPKPQQQQRAGQGQPHGKPQGKPQGRPHGKPAGNAPPRQAARGEIDLAKAYALRNKTEREEKEREQREAEQRGKERKERRQKLTALLDGKSLNDAAADIPRHFPHANKIRRIYVTAEQLPRLNGGELAVVQVAGRYLLVTRETGVAAQSIDPEALVLACDPQAVDEDGVPADLVW
jgi:uncharacterized protein YaiL (DUF2058 family)